MSPPIARPFPRFIADAAQEKLPYGRWAERLAEAFTSACEPLATEAGGPVDTETLRWFPERGWGGRVYVPVTARAVLGEDEGEEEGPASVEYFGHVSFERPERGEPRALSAKVDFTDVTADENPDWRIDLNDDVIGAWHADRGRGGEITLIWGLPLVRGAVAATAELDGEVIDQAAIDDGRFTLIAVDAVRGFADDLYLEIVLWDRTLRRVVARESLYDDADEGEEAEEPEATEAESGSGADRT
jgi:hypothetical protein